MAENDKAEVVRDEPSPWRAEGKEILTGFSGSFIFGVPLLYTMEVWWQGNRAGAVHMTVVLGVTYALLLLLIRTAGFKQDRAASWARIALDAAEALAIGLLAAAGALPLIGSVRLDMGLGPILGRIVLEGLPFGVGVGIANFLLRPSGRKGPDDGEGDSRSADYSWRGTATNLGAAALGSIVIASVIAPSQEVPLIASRLSTGWLLGLLTAALLLSYMIVFVADFVSAQARATHPGIFRHPLSQTVAALIVSLLTSAGMLLIFQQLDFADPPAKWVSFIIVLNLPATIGGATGRLVL